MKYFFFRSANTAEAPLNSSTLTGVITVLFIRSWRQPLPGRHKQSYSSHPRPNEALRRPLKSKHNQRLASELSVSRLKDTLSPFNKWSSQVKLKGRDALSLLNERLNSGPKSKYKHLLVLCQQCSLSCLISSVTDEITELGCWK